MASVGSFVSSKNHTHVGPSGRNHGNHNEANYSGLTKGQGVDWSTTAHGRGYFPGVWQNSPYGPVTYGDILRIAAEGGDAFGEAAFAMALEECGNSGQISIIMMMHSDIFINAWHYSINEYGPADEYLTEHCAYPSAVESILQDAGDFLDTSDTA